MAEKTVKNCIFVVVLGPVGDEEEGRIERTGEAEKEGLDC